MDANEFRKLQESVMDIFPKRTPQKLSCDKEPVGIGEDCEITKINYEQGLKQLIDLVELADFVAIDATIETTGLVLHNERWNPDFVGESGTDLRDPWGEWYDNVKTGEKNNFLIEVGVALFKRIPGKPKDIECEAFNIPVLPACVDDNELARFHGPPICPHWRINGWGREFIETVKFDINKPFYMGAPYLNKDLVKLANHYMVENPDFMVADRKRKMNSYLMPRVVDFVCQEDRDEICDRLRGISKLFEAISKMGKPVVGHHLFLKLMFIYKDFFTYLPDTYPEYYDKIRSIFKIVYDTKFLAQQINDLIGSRTDRASGKTLYEVFRNINKGMNLVDNPNTFYVKFCERTASYADDTEDLINGHVIENDPQSFCYVAGFDALIAGLLFLDLVKMTDFYEIECWKLEPPLGSSGDDESSAASKKKPHIVYQRWKDYLDMFLKGQPTRFVNKLYDECPVVEEPGAVTQYMTYQKKMMRFKMDCQAKRALVEYDRDLRFLAFSSGQFTP